MSEIANDAGGAAVKMSEKALEALFALLKWLMEAEDRKLARDEKKLRVEELEHGEISRKLDRSAGYKSAKELMRGGDPLAYASATFDEAGMRRFEEIAMRESLVYSSTQTRSESGEISWSLIAREKDTPHVYSIAKRVNEEALQRQASEKISELEGKESPSARDREDLAALKELGEDIGKEAFDSFNDASAAVVFSEASAVALEGEKARLEEAWGSGDRSFDKALNRFTGRDIGAGRHTAYVIERTNPASFIKLTSSQASWKGESYIKTEYEVFRDGEPVAALDDGRFDGREKGHWPRLRAEMREKGGFSDDVVVFRTKDELERYQALHAAQRKGIEGLKAEPGRIGAAIESLSGQLERNSKALSNIEEGIPDAHALDFEGLRAESLVIEAQLANLSEQLDARHALLDARDAYAEAREKGDQALAAASKEAYEAIQGKQAALAERASGLAAERERLSGAFAARDVQEEGRKAGKEAARDPAEGIAYSNGKPVFKLKDLERRARERGKAKESGKRDQDIGKPAKAKAKAGAKDR